MSATLHELEAAFAAAKTADPAAARALLPALNEARRAARAADQARIDAMHAQGRHADGRPMTLDEKLIYAIFGSPR